MVESRGSCAVEVLLSDASVDDAVAVFAVDATGGKTTPPGAGVVAAVGGTAVGAAVGAAVGGVALGKGVPDGVRATDGDEVDDVSSSAVSLPMATFSPTILNPFTGPHALNEYCPDSTVTTERFRLSSLVSVAVPRRNDSTPNTIFLEKVKAASPST